MEYKIKRLRREKVFGGSALEFMQDLMELPDGKRETWDFVHHRRGGGACVVPVLDDGRILMIRQFRPAVGLEMLELPAGARDSENEDSAVTARRELREETGYDCSKLHFLTSIHTAVAYCDEKTDIYLARGLVRAGGQKLDEAEEISAEPHALDELCSAIFRGEMTDAKTVAGIMAYAVFSDLHPDSGCPDSDCPDSDCPDSHGPDPLS